MANMDFPSGLSPVIGVGGNASIRVTEYTVEGATEADAIGKGSLVYVNGSGGVAAATTGANTTILGVSIAPIAASSSDRTILVCDDPMQTYEVQDDGASTTISDVFDVQGHFFAVTGNDSVTNDLSQGELDGSSGTQTATTSLYLVGVGFAKNVDNDTSATNVRVHVRIAPLCSLWL